MATKEEWRDLAAELHQALTDLDELTRGEASCQCDRETHYLCVNCRVQLAHNKYFAMNLKEEDREEEEDR